MRKFKINMITPVLFIADGKIDAETAPILEEALYSCARDKDVNLDFSDVYYISSAGIGVILQRQKDINGQIHLLNPSEVVMDILEITGFKEQLSIKRS